MLTLHHGSGARDFAVGAPVLTGERWTKVRAGAVRWLERRRHEDAVLYLKRFPFRLFHGHNGFGDEFTVLHASISFDQYMELNAIISEDDRFTFRFLFRRLAEAFGSASGENVRFVSVAIDDSDVAEPVNEPELVAPSETVARALADVRELLAVRGAASAVDRLHTAFHGFLKDECAKASVAVPFDAGLTTLFKALRIQHPKFKVSGPESEHVERMLSALATIADAANPVRNRATLAHANPVVLEAAEATLVINAIRALFNYVHDKLGAA